MTSLASEDLSIHSLPIPEDIRVILEKMGIHSLYPSQAQCITPLFQGKNLVLAVPTASGKTLIAYLAMLNNVLHGGKALYIVPLRSLAFEKYDELREFVPHGIKVGLSVGDYTVKDEYVRNYDILIATSEKVDSLLRNRSLYYNELSTFVADEIHLLDDPTRGATLEVILTKIMLKNPASQIIGLSATIPNAKEIADWLHAELIYSDWRPVELKKGALSGTTILFEDGSEKNLDNHLEAHAATAPSRKRKRQRPGDEILNVVLDTINNHKQILVFQNTRRSTESLSRQLGGHLFHMLSEEEKEHLERISTEILNSQVDVVPMIEELARTVRSGAAYHHAGLTNAQRKLVEQAFLKGYIKSLCATPTLAAGVNLPAQRVVVKDIYRYGQFGMEKISTLEIQQMLGRAGRPQYDSYGEALVVTPSKKTAEAVVREVLKRKPSDIVSKLFLESNLRMHILGFIVEKNAETKRELEHVLSKTFLAHQGGAYGENLEKVLVFLEEHGFIRCERDDIPDQELTATESTAGTETATPGEKSVDETYEELLGFSSALTLQKKHERQSEDYPIRPREFGYKTARLYIDPYSAVEFKKALEYIKQKQKTNPDIVNTDIVYLQALCRATELLPLFLRRGDFQELMKIAYQRKNELLLSDKLDEKEDVSSSQDLEWYFAELKTALFFEDWVSERREKFLTGKYNIGPGDIRSRVEVAHWLLGALYEISKMQELELELPFLKDLVTQVEFGIKSELLPLVKIRGIGRVRARILFDAGYTTPRKVKGASEAQLAKLPKFGEKIAQNIKKELLGGNVE